MRSWCFPYNSVALCADNFVRLCHFCIRLTALLDEVGISPCLVFPIMITDYKIDVEQTPQIPNKMVKELITLEQNSEKIFT